MRIVFMGTPAFAVPSLRSLAERHEVALVVTQPDRASGRGACARPTPVKEAALELGLPVLQPHRLTAEAIGAIAVARPGVIAVAAFGMLLPPEVLEIPPFGCVNVHASLLPRYRGAAPIQRAILAGDAETGVSIMRMERGLDTGPYALQRVVPIGDRYAEEIEAALAEAGASALVEVLERLESGGVEWVAQEDAAATHAAKIAKDDVALRPELTVEEAYRRVRAASRRAPARACLGDRDLTVTRATPVADAAPPGSVCVIDGAPVLSLTDGGLRLDVVRPSGKADMAGTEWARGARLDESVCWRCTR
ncbi:MAG: methionyl-tRNA formyltransferase [Coriobacteriia bacterium]|nr:methionyl-tRNA formyltransferase [Coriobacteriia bacterium]